VLAPLAYYDGPPYDRVHERVPAHRDPTTRGCGALAWSEADSMITNEVEAQSAAHVQANGGTGTIYGDHEGELDLLLPSLVPPRVGLHPPLAAL
jgi:hypothetical protein